MKLSNAELAIIEPSYRANFYPFSLTRPIFDSLYGSKSLIQRIESFLGRKFAYAFVPEYLVKVAGETHPNVRMNEEISRSTIAVSSLVSSEFPLGKEIENACSSYNSNFVVVDNSDEVIFAVLDELYQGNFIQSSDQKLNRDIRRVEIKSHPKPLVKYPWDLIAGNSEAIASDFATNEESRWRDSNDMSTLETLGKKFKIFQSAIIGRYVTLDSRKGPIIIDEEAEVQSFSCLSGPCYIGKKTLVKSAKIREGTSIGDRCKIAGEIDSTIVSDYTNKSHEGFIGHSYIGSWVNLGAGTTNSDLKNTYGEIRMNRDGRPVMTGLNKLGVFIGDMSKTAIGTLIFSGKNIGVSSQVFGTISRDVPSFTLCNGSKSEEIKEMYFDSARETQRKMMARREVTLTPSFEEMMRRVFEMTTEDRKSSGVRQGRFGMS